MPGVGNVGDFQKLFFRIHSKGEFAPIIRKTQCSGFAKRSITSRKTKRIQNTKHRNAIVSMHACPFHVNLYVLVKEVSVSSAYFCYKFVVCLIFLHFFQKIWLLMNLYIPLQRGSDILKTTESSPRSCRTSADRNVGCCNFMVESITNERAWSQIAPLIMKVFLQKGWVSLILLLPLPYLSGLIHILICNTKIGKKIWHGKILSNFLLLRYLKR